MIEEGGVALRKEVTQMSWGDIVMSTVLKATLRKTLDVDGGLSLSGEDWRPRSRSKWPRAVNASLALAGTYAPPKFVQSKLRDLGSVSRKPRKVFGPVKPF